MQDMEGLKVPAPLLMKETEPPGAEGEAAVSVTVAVQVEATPTFTEDAAQTTTVEVGSTTGGTGVTVRAKGPELAE